LGSQKELIFSAFGSKSSPDDDDDLRGGFGRSCAGSRGSGAPMRRASSRPRCDRPHTGGGARPNATSLDRTPGALRDGRGDALRAPSASLASSSTPTYVSVAMADAIVAMLVSRREDGEARARASGFVPSSSRTSCSSSRPSRGYSTAHPRGFRSVANGPRCPFSPQHARLALRVEICISPERGARPHLVLVS
jgi:hypothetical protein